MFRFLKKILIKLALYIVIIFLAVFNKLYKIILDFLVKHKLKFVNFYVYISQAVVSIKGLYAQINLKKEFQRCLINSK